MTGTYRVAYLAEDGAPLAVFLDSGPQTRPGALTVYARIGEHGEAAVEYLRRLPLASEQLYHGLHTYLTKRYAGGPGESLTLVVDQKGVPR